MKSKELERLSLYEALFEHPGWELLCAEVLDPEIADFPDRVFRHARNYEDLVAGRAAYSKLLEIRGLPDIIRQQREEADSQDNLDGGP